MRATQGLRALLLVAGFGTAALAQTAAAPAADAQTAPAPAAATPAPPANDFELLPAEKAPDPAAVARGKELSNELSRRRSLLQLHQIGGYATVATVLATTIVGQLNYNDKYGGGGYTGRYIAVHRWMGLGTATIFTATALLAVFAPSPLPNPLRLDSTAVHRVAMITAAAGILAQIVLGPITASKEGQISQRDFARAHQIIGYATLAATATGFAVLVF